MVAGRSYKESRSGAEADLQDGQPFTMIAALLLLVVAAGHAYRLFAVVPVVVGGSDVPLWVSWPGAIVPALLSLMVFTEARK